MLREKIGDYPAIQHADRKAAELPLGSIFYNFMKLKFWVNHLRKGDDRLDKLLENGQVLCHPFVIGELACGNIKNRSEILNALNKIDRAPTIALDE